MGIVPVISNGRFSVWITSPDNPLKIYTIHSHYVTVVQILLSMFRYSLSVTNPFSKSCKANQTKSSPTHILSFWLINSVISENGFSSVGKIYIEYK